MPSRPVLLLLTLLLAPVVPLRAQTISTPPVPLQQPVDRSFTEALANGLAALNASRPAEAVAHLRQAILFDPSSTQARLALGQAYAAQVVPNLDSPENRAVAANALDNLASIPASAPEYTHALALIAGTERNLQQLAQARATELQILQLTPDDPEVHYALGVMDWQQSYANALTVLAAAGLKDDGAGNPSLPATACATLVSRNGSVIEDGLDHLTRAVDLRPGYTDAMQYLSLTYRRRADLACGDDARRSSALAQADQWSARARQSPQPPPSR